MKSSRKPREDFMPSRLAATAEKGPARQSFGRNAQSDYFAKPARASAT